MAQFSSILACSILYLLSESDATVKVTLIESNALNMKYQALSSSLQKRLSLRDRLPSWM